MGLREEIIRVLEEADRPLSDSEINERMKGEREDQAMWRPRKDLEEEGMIEGKGSHPTRWVLTDKEYSSSVEKNSREDAPSEANIRPERNLEKYVFDNLSDLESGLKRVTKGDSRQRQVESGRLDILAEDENNGLVVIELKRGEAKRDALGQTMAYMADIDREFPEREVRGIIVSDSFSHKLTKAVSQQPNVQRYSCTEKFTLEQLD